MTDQERQQAFVAAYNTLVTRYGYALQARTVPADTPVPVTPPCVVLPVADWTPPVEVTDESKVKV